MDNDRWAPPPLPPFLAVYPQILGGKQLPCRNKPASVRPGHVGRPELSLVENAQYLLPRPRPLSAASQRRGARFDFPEQWALGRVLYDKGNLLPGYVALRFQHSARVQYSAGAGVHILVNMCPEFVSKCSPFPPSSFGVARETYPMHPALSPRERWYFLLIPDPGKGRAMFLHGVDRPRRIIRCARPRDIFDEYLAHGHRFRGRVAPAFRQV